MLHLQANRLEVVTGDGGFTDSVLEFGTED